MDRQDTAKDTENVSTDQLQTLRAQELAALEGAGRFVRFEPGGIELSGASDSAITRIAETLVLHSDVSVQIEIHVNEDLDAVENLQLSRQRARKISESQVNQGVRIR